MNVADVLLAPPAADAFPAEVRHWLGALAAALDAGKELPEATRRDLAARLHRVARGRSADLALGLTRPAVRPKRPELLRVADAALYAGPVVAELRAQRSRGERPSLARAVASRAAAGELPPGWDARSNVLRRHLAAWRGLSAANARTLDSLLGRRRLAELMAALRQ